ncbi:MAG: substrate-binding domain-containing protein [Mobilitalea sp.]
MRTSIRSISEITGFSPATISNAINHKKGVNIETSEKIFRVAKEIGYMSELKVSKIMLVIYKRDGTIIDNSPFFTNLLQGVDTECRESGFDMVICNLDRRSDDFESRINEILNDKSTGVIMLGTEAQDEDFIRFKDAKCPLIILDSWSTSMEFNGVMINNSDSAKNAVEYLIHKGHKEIGYLRGEFRIKAFSSRNNGYLRALHKNNIHAKEEYVVTLHTTMDGAYKDMLNYLQNKPLLPTAFFADNDMIALGAMKALIEKGYRVPEDVSLIGFDDLASCEISTPRLTTIKVFKQEMGQMAVRRLFEVIQNPNGVKTKTQFCTEFVERDSVKDLT